MTQATDRAPAAAGATTGDVPTRTELVERATALVPLLAQDAAQADRDRNLTPRVVDAITRAGLLKLMVPQRLGGYETDGAMMLEVVAELGRGCGAAAWVAGVMNFTAWEVGLFAEQAQRDVWEQAPDARAYFSISPTATVEDAEGGLVLSGRWANGSGSAYADWAALGFARSFGPAGPQFAKALVPVSEGTIEQTWLTTGMRGTASNTLVLDSVFVPEHRLLPDLRATVRTGERLTPFRDEQLYRANYAAIGTIGIMAPQLGMVEAAYAELLAFVDGKPIPAAGVKDQTTMANFQMRVAEARTKIDTAWMLARRAAETTDAGSHSDEPLPDLLRGQLRMDMTWASRQLVETMEILMAEGGFSTFNEASPLQRIWRDLSLATRHSAFRQSTATETYGRLLVGLDAGPTFPF
jgi:3-hydroxy-9,10-secoandrosta-1,3,5(10)-triene-9,17-dione monooxygenase